MGKFIPDLFQNPRIESIFPKKQAPFSKRKSCLRSNTSILSNIKWRIAKFGWNPVWLTHGCLIWGRNAAAFPPAQRKPCRNTTWQQNDIRSHYMGAWHAGKVIFWVPTQPAPLGKHFLVPSAGYHVLENACSGSASLRAVGRCHLSLWQQLIPGRRALSRHRR